MEIIFRMIFASRQEATEVAKCLLASGYKFCSTPEKAAGSWHLSAYKDTATDRVSLAERKIVKDCIGSREGHITGWSVERPLV